MIKQYNNELIKSYLNGDGLDNYNIEELENDYHFMKNVIEYSQDKNIYELCSEQLKANHQFVKFLLLTFKDDVEFIIKVADYYISKQPKTNPKSYNQEKINVEYEEIIILISILTKNKIADDKNIFYQASAFAIYKNLRIQIALISKELENEGYLSQKIGLGFYFVLDTYGTSDIIMEDFAQRYLLELFEESKVFNLEKYLHERFLSFKDIEKIGITNFLIQFIKLHDECLASYVSVHPYLLNNLLNKRLTKIKRNWQKFETTTMQRKIEILFYEVEKYLKDKELEYIFNTTDIVCYLTKKLGLINLIKDYDELLKDFDDHYEDIKEYYEMLFAPQILNFTQKKALTELENIIKVTLRCKTIDETPDDYTEIKERKFINSHKVKILSFNPTKEN